MADEKETRVILVGVGAVSIAGTLCNSLAQLANVYAVDIATQPTGNEWVTVGEELSAAMEECADEPAQQLILPIQTDELVEA